MLRERDLKTNNTSVIALTICSLIFCSIATTFAVEKETPINLTQFASPGCIFSGTFKQDKEVTGLADPLQSEGVFLSHCNKGIIWKTVSPIKESLVFTQAGRRVRIESGQSTILKSPQSRILGELMNGLVAWNPHYIEENFDWQAVEGAANTIELIPKKRSLKRAIHSVKLWKAESNLHDNTSNKSRAHLATPSLNIALLDARLQSTHIKAKIEKLFDENVDSEVFCTQAPEMFDREECAALSNRTVDSPSTSVND